MNLLYALESVRTPFWDAVFSAVTHLEIGRAHV